MRPGSSLLAFTGEYSFQVHFSSPTKTTTKLKNTKEPKSKIVRQPTFLKEKKVTCCFIFICRSPSSWKWIQIRKLIILNTDCKHANFERSCLNWLWEKVNTEHLPSSKMNQCYIHEPDCELKRSYKTKVDWIYHTSKIKPSVSMFWFHCGLGNV